jgi:hypothetical protein
LSAGVSEAHEAHLSTQPPTASSYARFPCPHAHQEWPHRVEAAPRQGPEASHGFVLLRFGLWRCPNRFDRIRVCVIVGSSPRSRPTVDGWQHALSLCWPGLIPTVTIGWVSSPRVGSVARSCGIAPSVGSASCFVDARPQPRPSPSSLSTSSPSHGARLRTRRLPSSPPIFTPRLPSCAGAGRCP